MIEQFYPSAHARRRLYDGPLGPFVDGFASTVAEQGYTRSSGHARLQVVGDFNRWLRRRRLSAGDLNEERLAEFQRQLPWRDQARRRGATRALHALLDHLRALGAVPVAEKVRPTETERILIGYRSYLEGERGIGQGTVTGYLSAVRCFLQDKFPRGRIQLGDLRSQDLNRHVLRRARSLSPSSGKNLVAALRSFSHFLQLRGDIEADLATSVLAVPRRRLGGLPRSLEPKQVRQVLRQCNRRTAIGQRDHAILLFLARMGLRASEVLTMMLDDIDWDAGEVVVRGKGPRTERMPLPQDVGRVLADYLRRARPKGHSARRVFLRTIAPIRGLGHATTISGIVARAIKKAGLAPPTFGAHLLRHSLASNVLRRGGSLTELGELLRHRHLDTTALYGKVDINALRSVALPWPARRRR